jgi:predicted O-methyltransferase YrrM
MSQDRWTAVDTYVDDLFVGSDPVLAGVLEASAAAGLPAISVSPSQGKLLNVLARAIGARRILELGTLGGYSAIWLARALPPRGRLVTIEAAAAHAGVARANFERAGLTDVIDLRVGPALEVLPQLAAEGVDPFDLIFIDADKPNYPKYLDATLRLSRTGSLIVTDNVVRHGDVIEEHSADAMVQGARQFNAALASNPRVTATVVQTVGSKGYDGFAIGIVLEGAR